MKEQSGHRRAVTDSLAHLSLGLVQHKSFAPVLSLVDFADVELHLGTVLVLHGLPLVQSHLLGTFVLHFLSLILPSTQNTQHPSYLHDGARFQSRPSRCQIKFYRKIFNNTSLEKVRKEKNEMRQV